MSLGDHRAGPIPGIPPRTLQLDERLRLAGVGVDAPALEAWLGLRDHEGERANVIDLYALAARASNRQPTALPLEERYKLWRSVAPVISPGFEVIEDSTRRADPITIVDYDPAWPDRFALWRDQISDALGDFASRIEHIGSTSVPGLPAKPRVDIQVSVPDITQEDKYVSGIEALGVQLRSRDDHHRYFRPFPGKPRVVQIHVCGVGSIWERNHLLFRDYLRAHPDERDAYATVKRECAAVWREDSIGYTDAKGEIILDLLEKARTWAQEGGTR